jgi:hypothetical protein
MLSRTPDGSHQPTSPRARTQRGRKGGFAHFFDFGPIAISACYYFPKLNYHKVVIGAELDVSAKIAMTAPEVQEGLTAPQTAGRF